MTNFGAFMVEPPRPQRSPRKLKNFLGVLCVLCGCLAAPDAQAQSVSQQEADGFSIRGLAFASFQQFAAKTTFDAVFDESSGQFFGGGVIVAQHGVFLEVTLSHFDKTGQRAFLFNGDVFPLNIPLTATITPFEVAAGYRFNRRASVIPYAGGGFGSYGYKETSPSSAAGEDVDERHAGYLLVGGAEFRVARWVGVAADVQYTHIPGILGTSGLSKDAGESDLGGTAVRVKVLVGVGR
jgi:opacity protein-like surface antigen